MDDAKDSYLEPTVTNAVNVGVEETILLLEAGAANLQFDQLLTAYDREYASVLMRVVEMRI